jgi:adenylate kinase
LFESVPRKVDQQKYLEEEIQNSGRKIDAVIFINISEEETVKRIGKRWICKKNQHVLILGKDIKNEKDKCPIDGSDIFQRADDTPGGIKKRLEVYRKETMPVIEDYRKRDLLVEIDGTPSIEEVSKKIDDELKSRI